MPRKGGKGGKEGGKPEASEDKAPKGVTFDPNDPAIQSLIPLMQQRLGSVVGKSSGYFETLPKPVQDRVRALKKLQSHQGELDQQYKKELLQLEAKFRDLAKPLFEKRRDIITGSYEPKPEEMEEEKPKEGEEAKQEAKSEEPKKEVKPEDIKGIPGFWLEALKHHDDFSDMVQPEDEECLKHLIDIKCHPLENEEKPTPSFVLEFHFTPNEWFEETILIKTYHLFEDTNYGEVMYDHVDCPKITWKSGKNLTVKEVTKQVKVGGKARGGKGGRGRDRGGKGAQQTKTITVQEPVPSFFQFFNLNLEPEEMESEEQVQDILEADYEMGLAIKQQLIPNAVMWYTGEAETMDFGLGGGEDDDGDVDQDEDEEEDKEYEPSAAPGGAQPECKQQ